MMKKIALATLILSLAALTLGCGGEEATTGESYADYDLSQYVELGQYTGIEVEVVPAEVTEDELQTEIDNILSQNAVHEEITTGTVAEGDTVNIDYEGKIDGVAFDGGTDQGYELTIGSGSFIEGFEEGLIGVAVGDTVDIELTFPDPYELNAELAGQPAVFTVTVNSICVDTPPDYTDEFVQSISEYATTAEHTEYVRAYLLESAEAASLTDKQNAVWNAILENSTILEYPQAQVDLQVEEATAYYEQMATAYYSTDLETMVTSYMQMTMEDFEGYVLEEAQSAVANSLIFYAIAEAEGIELSQEDYDNGIVSYLEEFGFADADAFETQYGSSFEEFFGEDAIRESLLWEKVLNFVTDSAVEI
ncbi:MAG: trigger factor [Bacillota bacterium]|nr:trigger factor [Bacillota bacterium]